MKKQKELKISFLMAAHNEEKIIYKALDNLARLPYTNYEIIVGLDGCTDDTEKIVKSFEKKSKRFKHYNLNLRQGKPAVINSIISKAKGEIIIIVDADWVFTVKDRKTLQQFLSVFDNPKIGGIAEAFAIEDVPEKIKEGNLGYKMVAYSSRFWFEFQRKKFAQKKDGLLYLSEPTMFLTNIYRKSLYKENASLGDDFERTKDIMDSGHEVVLFDSPDMPRMVAVYDKVYVRDIFKQKLRTAVAREQLQESSKMNVRPGYYLKSTWYIFVNSWKSGLSVGAITTFWIALTVTATLISAIKSKFKKTTTREGWALRMRR